MSFRNRLTLFLVVIVIVPMLVLTLVFFRLVSDSAVGKSNARVGQAERTAQRLYGDGQRRAEAAVRRIGTDAGLSAAVAAGLRRRVGGQHELRVCVTGIAR